MGAETIRSCLALPAALRSRTPEDPHANSIAAFVLTVLGAGAEAEDAADTILVNGRIYTLESSQPWAEALAVKGDRILAVGTNAEIRRFKGTATREIDLGGAFASPGFNDSHVHVDGTGALLTGVGANAPAKLLEAKVLYTIAGEKSVYESAPRR